MCNLVFSVLYLSVTWPAPLLVVIQMQWQSTKATDVRAENHTAMGEMGTSSCVQGLKVALKMPFSFPCGRHIPLKELTCI